MTFFVEFFGKIENLLQKLPIKRVYTNEFPKKWPDNKGIEIQTKAMGRPLLTLIVLWESRMGYPCLYCSHLNLSTYCNEGQKNSNSKKIQYRVPHPNLDSYSTVHSTMRVRIWVRHPVHIFKIFKTFPVGLGFVQVSSTLVLHLIKMREKFCSLNFFSEINSSSFGCWMLICQIYSKCFLSVAKFLSCHSLFPLIRDLLCSIDTRKFSRIHFSISLINVKECKLLKLFCSAM